MGNVISESTYEEIYKDVNQPLPDPLVGSEVMTISRMYLRSSDLLPTRFQNPEVVRRLYVFADVLLFDSSMNTWPGSEQLFLRFRIVLFPVQTNQGDAGLTIRAPWLHVPSTTFAIDTRQRQRSPFFSFGCRVEPRSSRAGTAPTSSFNLHAQQIVTMSDAVDFAVPDNIVLRLDTLEGSSASKGDSNDDGEVIEAFQEINLPWAQVNLYVLWAMEHTLLTAELILTSESFPTRTVEEATLHLKWVHQMHLQAIETKSGKSDPAVERLFNVVVAQVALLLNDPSLVTGIVVPRVQYSAYRNLITTMAGMADGYTRDFRQLTFLMEQTEVLGTFLLEQNKAFAAKERDMESFHAELHKVKTNDLIHAIATLEQLEVHMTEMNAEMEQAQQDMEQGLRNFRNRQTARAVFSVFSSIVAIAAAFFTGGATAGAAVNSTRNAVSQLVEMRRSLDNIVAVLEKLLLVSDFLVAIRELVAAVQDVLEVAANMPERPIMPTDADWAIFENEIDAVAEQMPGEVSEVVVWRAKCRNMAAIGREMTTMTTVISQLQYDIKMHDLLQEISRNQADRLEAITPVDITNHQELAMHLEMRTTQLLLALLEVLALQNAAIQYQYLMPSRAVFVTSITMSDIWTELLQQEAGAIVALSDLGFPTDRKVTYVLQAIPVHLLMDGQDWEFFISTEDVDHFPKGWNRVRIAYVEMEFVSAAGSAGDEIHKPTTDSGEVYMILRGEQSLWDRRRGESVQYLTVSSMEYQYAYCLKTGKTTEQNRLTKEFANQFMRMTPFTHWKLRLPRSAKENRGLAFPTAAAAMDATTQIAIHFYVTAIRTPDWH